MSETAAVNYPDILGYITNGARYNINVVQVALAVRPRVVRAGRPFEAILLIQNVADVDVDVTATLQLPDTDAKKKPRRFITKSERLVVGLRPAEVGYVQLPLSSLPDTAVSDAYKIGMAVEVKPLAKPRRIRTPEGNGEVTLEYLSDETVAKLNEMKKLHFSTAKRGLMGTIIETPFAVMSSQIGQMVDFKPGWVSLWKISDHRDDRLLLDRYGEALKTQVLPQLKHENLYKPLFDTTEERFKKAGYTLLPAETHYITKLLTIILEMAAPGEETVDPLTDESFNVTLALKKGGTNGPLTLPGWCKGLLKAIDTDPTTAENPTAALASSLYDELLRDAMRHAFKVIAQSTGEPLGTDDETRDYGERLIADLMKGEKVTFTDAYLPLALAGVLYYDRAVLKDEQVGESLNDIAKALKARLGEVHEDNELIYQMAEKIIDRALYKFGYRA
ncbi:MAG: hypothetical protein K8L97_18565 [Anaerolineae bacterium]|nr:hypothetical protein [Anaerolineae bacterium]